MYGRKSSAGSEKSPSPGPGRTGPTTYIPPFWKPGYQGPSEAPAEVPDSKPFRSKAKPAWQPSKNPQKPGPALLEEPASSRWRSSQRQWQPASPQRSVSPQQPGAPQELGPEGPKEPSVVCWRACQQKRQPPTPQKSTARESPVVSQETASEKSQEPEEFASDRWRPSRRQWQPPTPRWCRVSQSPVEPQETALEKPEESAAQEPQVAATQDSRELSPEERPHDAAALEPEDAIPAEPAIHGTQEDEELDELSSLTMVNSSSSTEYSPTVASAEASPEPEAKAVDPESTRPFTTANVYLTARHYGGTVEWAWSTFLEDMMGHYCGVMRPDIKFADLSSYDAAVENSLRDSVRLDEDFLQLEYTDREILDLLTRKWSENFEQTWVQLRWKCVTSPGAPVYEEWQVGQMSCYEQFQAEASLAIVRDLEGYYRYQRNTGAGKVRVRRHGIIEGAFCGGFPGHPYLYGLPKPRYMMVLPVPEEHKSWSDDL